MRTFLVLMSLVVLAASGCMMEMEDLADEESPFEDREVFPKETVVWAHYYAASGVCQACDTDTTYYRVDRDAIENADTTGALEICCGIPLPYGATSDGDFLESDPRDITAVRIYGVCGNNDGSNDADEYEAWLYARDSSDTTPDYHDYDILSSGSCGIGGTRSLVLYPNIGSAADLYLSVELHLPHVDAGRVSEVYGIALEYSITR